ncbi:unnamed protein product [Urochloa decumbens]|uniref:F-box domain-containing protein n=1 Tax=Urochloa decumbens TaxID=240449 RepID=A0ABC8X571_9POAL
MEEQHQQQGNDDGLILPEDVLAEQILRRLAPRDLAVCRCVCAEWKVAVDGRRLLRADLLPLSVGGIFLNFEAHRYAEFLRPPSSCSSVSGDLTHVPCPDGSKVMDHCNGLVLLDGCVVANPATGWWAPLPPWPAGWPNSCQQVAHIVFDPAVSPHYSVFLVSYASLYGELQGDPAAEWPPSPYPFHVFSSTTGRWEERPFLRQGGAAGAIADVRFGGERTQHEYRCFAAYYSKKQALYVHCQNNFFLRISLSRDEYQVIKPPPGISVHSGSPVLGKSEKGPYLAAIFYPESCFKVWILDESDQHQSQWVLRHCNNHLGMMLPPCYLDKKVCGPWVLEDINYNEDRKQDAAMGLPFLQVETATPVVKHKSDCSSIFDEDNFTLDGSTTEDGTSSHGGSCYIDDFWVFGFHPYKEIVFLGSGYDRVVAYDLHSSKFQYLGNIHPTDFDVYYLYGPEGIDETFVYTPCKLEAYGHQGSAPLAA